MTLEQLSAPFDAFHAPRTGTGVLARLYAAAMGDDYPEEVGPSSSCDWPLLGLMAARLRLRPGSLLVDAGCGSAGAGLWLARASACHLIGLDISPVAIRQATARRDQFGLPAARATFRVAALESTGLPDGSADGIVCVDALSFATHRTDAVREFGRVLAPGGRLVVTRALRRGSDPAWGNEAQAAGLTVESADERPDEPAMWERVYRLWIEHGSELRRELGETQAENRLWEARRMLPLLPGRRAVLVTLRRPATAPVGTAQASTMTAARVGGATGTFERTPK